MVHCTGEGLHSTASASSSPLLRTYDITVLPRDIIRAPDYGFISCHASICVHTLKAGVHRRHFTYFPLLGCRQQ